MYYDRVIHSPARRRSRLLVVTNKNTVNSGVCVFAHREQSPMACPPQSTPHRVTARAWPLCCGDTRGAFLLRVPHDHVPHPDHAWCSARLPGVRGGAL